MSAPVAVAGGQRWTDLATGPKHVCGVARELLCWGQPVYEPSFGLGPTPIERAPPRLTRVSGGSLHSCALAENGAAFCWGTGESGVLGSGLTLGSRIPMRVLEPGGGR